MPILVEDDGRRDAVRARLRDAHGMQTSVFYPAMHEFTAYRERFGAQSLPRAERVARTEITIPLFAHLTRGSRTAWSARSRRRWRELDDPAHRRGGHRERPARGRRVPAERLADDGPAHAALRGGARGVDRRAARGRGVERDGGAAPRLPRARARARRRGDRPGADVRGHVERPALHRRAAGAVRRRVARAPEPLGGERRALHHPAHPRGDGGALLRLRGRPRPAAGAVRRPRDRADRGRRAGDRRRGRARAPGRHRRPARLPLVLLQEAARASARAARC